MENSFAPFNFIPLSEKVFKRYNSIDELPRHDEYCEGTLSGEIEYTIENNTDLIISDGKGKFFKNTDGEYAIPGNTIRGKLRSNIQILGLSAVGDDIENDRFIYRPVGGKCPSLIKEYNNKLNVKIFKVDDKIYSEAMNVNGGYIKKIGEDEYEFYKSKSIDKKTFFKIDDNFLKEKAKGIKGIFLLSKGNYKPYRKEIYFKCNSNNEVIDIKELECVGFEKGCLIGSGKMNKKDVHYIITERTNESEKLDKEIVRMYKKDLDKNRLDNFYSLPDTKDEYKAIFYAKVNKKIYFGNTQFIRIPYDNGIHIGIKKDHKMDIIDYSKGIFGFSKVDENTGDKKVNKSYKGRVFVEDAVRYNGKDENNKIIEDVKPVEIVNHVMVLAEPKATCVQLYLEQCGDNKNLKSYNGDFKIRGIKYYWLKDKATPVAINNEMVDSNEEGIKGGAIFKGKIKFDNLYEDELGLLLWALYIHEDANQSIGKGKPYGFGNIKIKDIKLKIKDLNDRYSDIFGNSMKSEDIGMYIEKYKNYMKKEYKNIEELMSIRVFIEVHNSKNKTRKDKVEYMSIQRKVNGKSFNEFGTYIPLSKPLEILGKSKEGKCT